MIPDFKTFIGESIWSDMQDRGNGDIIKAEDDINNMDSESLYEYIKENYEIDVDHMGWAEDTNNPDNTYFYTYVPILSTKKRNDAVYYLCRDFSMPCTVSINSEITHDFDSKIYKTLKDNYIVNPIDSDFLSISPKNGGKVDNEFFIEVLNFIIDNTDETYLNVRHKSVNESIWSDMQDRGSGDLIKKEDDIDVDLMDHNEFCDYLNDHYKASLGKIEYNSSLNELEVPILTQGTGWHALLTMEYGRVKRICFGKDLPKDFPEVFIQINKKFILRREKHKRWISFYFYQAKNVGEATNSFFLTVLDFIISTGDKNLIVSKNLKESIWSDMQERGTGDIDKREDSVNLMSIEKFTNYLSKRYSFKDDYKIEYDKKISMLSIPGLCTDVTFGHDNIGVDYEKDSSKIQYVWILDSALPGSVRSALKKRFELSAGNTYTFLSPLAGGKPTNQFVVDVLDYMADLNMDDINIRRAVKESIWSDMQDRGSGDMVKKEDEIDHKDIEEFYEYLGDKYYFPRDYYFKCYEEIRMIEIPLCQQDAKIHNLMYKPAKHQLFVLKYFISYLKSKNIYEQFNDKYRLEEQHMSYAINVLIEPKDGSEVTNSFCVEVLEFIIDLMDGNVKQDMIMVSRKENESIWTDMQDRGSGDQVKKEDEVMLMDGERFYEYLKDRYDFDNSRLDKNTEIHYFPININNNTSCFMDIPLFAYNPPTLQKYGGVQDKASFLYYPDDNSIGFGCTSVRYHKLIGLRLEKQFVSQEKGISYYDNYFHGVDNEKVIEMLEFMIDNMKEPLIPILKRK